MLQSIIFKACPNRRLQILCRNTWKASLPIVEKSKEKCYLTLKKKSLQQAKEKAIAITKTKLDQSSLHQILFRRKKYHQRVGKKKFLKNWSTQTTQDDHWRQHNLTSNVTIFCCGIWSWKKNWVLSDFVCFFFSLIRYVFYFTRSELRRNFTLPHICSSRTCDISDIFNRIYFRRIRRNYIIDLYYLFFHRKTKFLFWNMKVSIVHNDQF